MLPFFRLFERDLDFGDSWHGRDGPIPIRRSPGAVRPQRPVLDRRTGKGATILRVDRAATMRRVPPATGTLASIHLGPLACEEQGPCSEESRHEGVGVGDHQEVHKLLRQR
jgi:hypothetical protein